MTSRRQFIKTAAFASAGAYMLSRRAWAFEQSPNLKKFVQALPGVGPSGANEYGLYIPVASPNTTKIPGVDYYKIAIGQYEQQVHPGMPKATKFWGYADMTHGKSPDFHYLGPAIVAKKDRPVQCTFVNQLPPQHILPIDRTMLGAEFGQAENRACVHLHGGYVPWISDGTPQAWWTPEGVRGPSFMHGVIPNYTPGNANAEYYWPNQQSARLMWYHDHAMGITRLNAYAGMAAPYIIYDDFELMLVSKGLLPDLVGIPLVLQEKAFKSVADQWGDPGDLWYPTTYEYEGTTARWEWGGGAIPNQPSCVPEFFGDTTMVNGAAYPYVNVEPRRYRFRMLNGTQARSYNLQLYYAKSSDLSNPRSGDADLKSSGPRMIQVGNEAGFLPAPVEFNQPAVKFNARFDRAGNYVPGSMKYNLLIAPAERADVIIDFSECRSGDIVILYNDAPAPLPSGETRNDYYTNDPDQSASGGAAPTEPGYGPNTRTLVQFRVVPMKGAPDALKTNHVIKGLADHLQANYAGQELRAHKHDTFRTLTLNEGFDEYGRLIQKLGTTGLDAGTGLAYMDPATEVVRAGAVERWRIYNLTADTHPIHFHLVNVQVIGRGEFDAATPNFAKVRPMRDPDPNESGWKETVRMNPGEYTEVIAKFSLPQAPFHIPTSPRFAEEKIDNAHEYVWHCHILEHEEHDMMRPLIVQG